MEHQDEHTYFTPASRLVAGEGGTPVAENRRRQTGEPSIVRGASAEVYNLDEYRDLERAPFAPAAIINLYRDRAHSNPHLARAVELLEDGRQALSQALQSSSEGDAIAADDAIQELQATLPELFLCRDLGDGYTAIVAGLHFAFENRNGEPLEHQQIETIGYVIQELYAAPFMSATSAYQLLGRLEGSGLIVTPRSLSDLFDDEQFG